MDLLVNGNKIIMTIYVTCGLPGSGKTTLSIKMSKKYNLNRYSWDELKGIMRLQEIYDNIIYDINHNTDVILDYIFLTTDARLRLLDKIKELDCKKILLVLNTPLEECLIRNRNSDRDHHLADGHIKLLNKRYQPPSLDEGWDDIIYI